MKMRKQLSVIGLFLLAAIFAVGCGKVAVPSVFATSTPPQPQVGLPTRFAVAVATPTVINLVPASNQSEATTMLTDFIKTIAAGNVDIGLTYWDTAQPGQATTYAANVRKMLQDWVDNKRTLVLTDITYLGLDVNGKYVPIPMSDPRVEQATAKIRIDATEYLFYLKQFKGGWSIEGVNTFSK
jgi:hypothetical protein